MDALMQFEILITLFFQHLGTWLALPFKAVTFLGTEEFYLLVLPALYWCVDATVGFRMAVMLVLTGSLNGYFKALFHSPRPYWVDARVKAYASETSFGLPSGHSQNSAALWGILAASFKKKWLTIVSIIAVFLIGLSRIYLGVHFTRDVLCGWLIGALLVFAYLWLEKPIQRWLSPRSLGYQITVAFLVSLLLIGIGLGITYFASSWPIPNEWVNQAIQSGEMAPDPYNIDGYFTIAGVWFGFAGGYAWLLHKKGTLSISGKTGKRITRYLLGLVGVVIIYAGLKLIFPTSPDWLGYIFRYIRYALLGLWVSALAPLLFEKLHLDQ